MTIFLIKEDNTYEEYHNVIEWQPEYIIYRSGRGISKIYAKEKEYFTDKKEETNK